MALATRTALVRVLPPRPSPTTRPMQGLGRRGGVSLAVRAKDVDDYGALLSEKPTPPAPAKRDSWEGFGRDVNGVGKDPEEEEEEVQSEHAEQATWGVLNQLGVELDSDKSYTALVMEVVGLGFTIWFTSRYLIFKENRDELITRVTSIKKQILGSHDN